MRQKRERDGREKKERRKEAGLFRLRVYWQLWVELATKRTISLLHKVEATNATATKTIYLFTSYIDFYFTCGIKN